MRIIGFGSDCANCFETWKSGGAVPYHGKKGQWHQRNNFKFVLWKTCLSYFKLIINHMYPGCSSVIYVYKLECTSIIINLFYVDIFIYFLVSLIIINYYFLSNSLVIINYVFKMNKWGVWRSNFNPNIYYINVSTSWTKFTVTFLISSFTYTMYGL
jgi:hypothetical protein